METVNNEVQPARYGPAGNYAISFIKEVINQLEEGMPLQEVLLVYKLRRSTLAEWVKRYASAQYRNNRKKPARHLKRSAVRAITNGTMTITEVMEACKVKTATLLKNG
jgi:hypothetical protein